MHTRTDYNTEDTFFLFLEAPLSLPPAPTVLSKSHACWPNRPPTLSCHYMKDGLTPWPLFFLGLAVAVFPARQQPQLAADLQVLGTIQFEASALQNGTGRWEGAIFRSTELQRSRHSHKETSNCCLGTALPGGFISRIPSLFTVQFALPWLSMAAQNHLCVPKAREVIGFCCDISLWQWTGEANTLSWVYYRCI